MGENKDMEFYLVSLMEREYCMFGTYMHLINESIEQSENEDKASRNLANFNIKHTRVTEMKPTCM